MPKGEPAEKPAHPTPAARERAPGVSVLPAIAARACQGLNETWLSGDAAIPWTAPESALLALHIESLASRDPTLPLFLGDPPVPPPRLASL